MNVYVSINGANQGQIKGECVKSGRQDTIEAYGVDLIGTVNRLPESGKPSGHPVHHPLTISKAVDRASPQLWQAFAKGEKLTEVKLAIYRRDEQGQNENCYTYTLRNAFIVGIENSIPEGAATGNGEAHPMREQVSLSYGELQLEHIAGTICCWKVDEN